MIRERIRQAIEDALKGLGVEAAFVVERPRAMSHGDYSTNAALVSKVDPQELRSQLRSLLGVDEIEKVEVVGKFINFFLSREELVPREQVILQLYAGKLALVEYTSPNLFKPLHIGNLISTVLGESIARLYEYAGAEVKRINYPSDIGPTIAKGVWGLQKLKLDPSDIAQLGRAYAAGSDAFENDEAAKKEIGEINEALYADSNPEWSSLRKQGIETSRRNLDELCRRLGTKFDKEFFESEAAPLGKKTVLSHTEDGVFEQSEGAIVYKGERDGLHTRVFINSKGLPTYEAKDLGLFELKRGAYPHFDITVTDTGTEQAEYFKVLYAVIRRLHPDAANKALLHSAHGTLKLTTGKMSSRTGNVITGESLLADLVEASKEKMQGRELKDADKTAEQVAVGAIKYAVLKQGSGRDIIFDPEKSLSLEGDSGPYLQYARVRALSLLEKAKEAGIGAGTQDAPKEAHVLERTLLHYSDAVARAAREMEPHYVTTYLTELAGAFNSWYASERIIGGTSPHYGVLLVEAFEKTMSQGLQALGIPAPEEM
jgi:arginyl-tRNA synthetase